MFYFIKELNPEDLEAPFSVKMDTASLEKLVPDEDNKYKCPLCKDKFISKDTLSNHFACHKFCHKCGKTFGVGNKRNRDFLRHIKKCGQEHMCNRCGTSFSYKSYLTRNELNLRQI